jgi:hypothetical protein
MFIAVAAVQHRALKWNMKIFRALKASLQEWVMF